MKLIILDRDGVINKESELYIKAPDEWFPIPGSLNAIARLTAAGFNIVIATNQAGVGRKIFTLENLQQIHQTMIDAVAKAGGKIHQVYFCPHHPDDRCNCRKPKPGMFEQIAQDFNLDVTQLGVPFIGDSLRDIELGLATGCNMFLVTNPDSYGSETLTQLTATQKQQITIVPDLAAAVDRLLE